VCSERARGDQANQAPRRRSHGHNRKQRRYLHSIVQWLSAGEPAPALGSCTGCTPKPNRKRRRTKTTSCGKRQPRRQAERCCGRGRPAGGLRVLGQNAESVGPGNRQCAAHAGDFDRFTRVAVTPDGRRAASASDGPHAEMCDLATASPLRTVDTPRPQTAACRGGCGRQGGFDGRGARDSERGRNRRWAGGGPQMAQKSRRWRRDTTYFDVNTATSMTESSTPAWTLIVVAICAC
jgi:hypothetical protein